MKTISTLLLSVALLLGFAVTSPANAAPVGQIRTYNEDCFLYNKSVYYLTTVKVKQITPTTIRVINVHTRGAVTRGNAQGKTQSGAMHFIRRSDKATLAYYPFNYITFGSKLEGPNGPPKRTVQTAGGLTIKVRSSYQAQKCINQFNLSSRG